MADDDDWELAGLAGRDGATLFAAFALQTGQEDGDRRASATSSVGGEGTGFYSLGGTSAASAWGATGRHPAASSPAKLPPASPGKRSPLGSGQKADGAAPAGEQYKQYQVLSSGGDCSPAAAHPQQRMPREGGRTAAAAPSPCVPAPAQRHLQSLPSFAFQTASPAAGSPNGTAGAAFAAAVPASAPPSPASILAAGQVRQAAAGADQQRGQGREAGSLGQPSRQLSQQQQQQHDDDDDHYHHQHNQPPPPPQQQRLRLPSREEVETWAAAADADADDSSDDVAQGEKVALCGGSRGPTREHTGDTEELALDDIVDEPSKPWYRRWSFWGRALSLTLSLCFFISGVVTLVGWPDLKLAMFSVWRWCFFLGCWPIIYWASVWAVWGLTRICEWRLFTARTAIYFLVGTRGALMLVIRSLLVLATFAALFQSQPNKDEEAAVQRTFRVILKVLGVLVLVTVANLIKKVLIKLMSTHHHREAHFGRMQEALRKEYFLSVLTQAREPRGSICSYASGYTAANPQSPRPKSFAKRWLSRQMLSKSMAALHQLPSMATRSFSQRRQHPQLGDSLLAEGIQLSDGQTCAPAAGVEKSNRSATAALTSISVVAGAGVEPSSRSMPNLAGLGLPAQQQQLQRGSRLAPQGAAGGAFATAGNAAAAGVHAQQPHQAQQAQQLSRMTSPTAAAIAAAAAAAAQPGLRASLASRQMSVLSGHTNPRSLSFRAHSKAGSLATLRSRLTAGTSKAPPPLVDLIDMDQPPQQQARATQGRRSSIVEMRPEELEKMHHIEKHIRKNQLKVGGLVEQLGHMKKKQRGDQTGVDEQEAHRVAYFLFHNVRASRKRNWIQQSDLEDFLPAAQAEEAFLYLDIDGNGKISQLEVRDSVVTIFQERAFLASTLRDTRSVIAKLERVLGGILHTLFGLSYLYIFGVDVSQAWLTVSSVVLAFTFIFGNSIRTVFECCVWLFVTHAYDVGDTLLLGPALEHHRVEEIALLNTVLVRFDGSRLYYPNTRLSTDQLTNLSRSNKKSESLKLALDMSTPMEVVEMLRTRVQQHVAASPQEFTGSSSVNVRGLGDPMKMVLLIWYEFTHNGVDTGRCSRARSGLYMMVASALNEAHVQFSLPPFPASDASLARAHGALEMQPEVVAAVGLPPFPEK